MSGSPAIEGYRAEFMRVLRPGGVAVLQCTTSPLWTLRGMLWRFAPYRLFFLCRKRWRPALTAMATFAACGLLAWVFAPGQSKQLTVVLLLRLRDDLTALVAVAVAGLLISPVSWSHHWVRVAPALLLLHGRVRIVVVAVCSVGPHWLFPTAGDLELAWTWWQHLVGNTYVWLGLAFLCWCAASALAEGESAERSRVRRFAEP